MTWTLATFVDDATLVTQLAERIADALRAGVVARGRAALAVSGGSTPRNLFQVLSSMALDWSRVDITLVDERWVSCHHPDSNAQLVKRHLRQGPAAAASFIGLTTDDADPAQAEPLVNQRLQELSWPLDATVLGMGEDGHTASWFPGAPSLERALAPPAGTLCCAIEPPTARHARMTLTLPAVLASRHLFLHLVGPAKQRTLERAMQPGPEAELPIRAVLHRADPPVEIFYAPH